MPPHGVLADNDFGVELLSKGKATEAVRRLEAAVATAPNFVLARYNLACARARAGDLDGARSDLEQVFESDLIGMRAHAEVDPDLVELWKSALGLALRAKLPDLEARYESVLRRGLHAILWQEGTSHRGGAIRPFLVRVGVYDIETARFLPVAPFSPSAFMGFASTRAPVAVVATGDVRETLGGDLDPGKVIDKVQFFPFSTRGVATTVLALKLEAYGATLELGSSGARLEACQVVPIDGDPGSSNYCAMFDVASDGAVTKKLAAPRPHAPPIPSLDRPVVIDLGYSHWGYVVTEADAAFTFRPYELTLPSGAKIAVPKEAAFYQASPRAIVASPAGDRIVLVFNATVLNCMPSSAVPGRYKLTLVEPGTGKVAVLGEGDGAGHATFRADGELFVQQGKRVYHVARDGALDTLPEGVLLVPPLDRDDNCGP